jgi:hypothetical protein
MCYAGLAQFALGRGMLHIIVHGDGDVRIRFPKSHIISLHS